jgi:hypothetical protein
MLVILSLASLILQGHAVYEPWTIMVNIYGDYEPLECVVDAEHYAEARHRIEAGEPTSVVVSSYASRSDATQSSHAI